MDRSPYAPPQSNLVERPPSEEDRPFSDLEHYSNAELRELLANPEVYTPEAVHQAARVLAGRHAIPRYYTCLRSRSLQATIRVGRTWNMDLVTKLHTLFSERTLKRYCLLLVVVEGLFVALRTVFFARWLRLSTSPLFPKHFEYVMTMSLSLLANLLLVLFLLALYRTLSIRSIEPD